MNLMVIQLNVNGTVRRKKVFGNFKTIFHKCKPRTSVEIIII